MSGELGINKSICILATVVVCFAILWPGIFYPMLKGSLLDNDDIGCCDILLEKDVNSVNLVTELCRYVLQTTDMPDNLYIRAGKLNKTVVMKCSTIVLDTCLVNISTLLSDKVQLGKSYRHVLEEIRTINKSLCLKYNFGVDLKLIGVPHRIKEVFDMSNRLKQDRQMMFPKPESIHPALKERGRAIPESHKVSKLSSEHRVSQASQNHFEIPSTVKRPPIPGMRPPMGAGMHTPVQSKGSGLLGILMPVYTIGIVIFFAYTIIRLMNKKQPGNETNYHVHDGSEFKKAVYENVQRYKVPEKQTTNLSNGTGSSPQFVVSAFSGLLEEVNRQLLTEQTMTPVNEDKEYVENEPTSETNKFDLNSDLSVPTCCCDDIHDWEYSDKNMTVDQVVKSDDKGSVRVVGMEIMESSESGKEWKSDVSSLINGLEEKVQSTPIIEVPSKSIVLTGKLQSDSKLFVTDTHTDVISADSSLVESKVTLSVVSPLLATQENENNVVEEVTFINDSLYDEENVENVLADFDENEENVLDDNSDDTDNIPNNVDEKGTNEIADYDKENNEDKTEPIVNDFDKHLEEDVADEFSEDDVNLEDVVDDVNEDNEINEQAVNNFYRQKKYINLDECDEDLYRQIDDIADDKDATRNLNLKTNVVGDSFYEEEEEEENDNTIDSESTPIDFNENLENIVDESNLSEVPINKSIESITDLDVLKNVNDLNERGENIICTLQEKTANDSDKDYNISKTIHEDKHRNSQFDVVNGNLSTHSKHSSED